MALWKDAHANQDGEDTPRGHGRWADGWPIPWHPGRPHTAVGTRGHAGPNNMFLMDTETDLHVISRRETCS